MLLNPYRFFIPISACDLYWNNVSSLLHFNGANGGTTFTDEKGLAWIAEGDATTSTAVSKFGGASLKTSSAGAGRAKYVIPSFTGSVWDLGITYTLEAFINPTSLGSDAVIVTIDEATQTDFAGLRLDISAAGLIRAVVRPSTGAGLSVLSSPSAVTTGVFTHVALSVLENQARLFVNGNQVAISGVGAWPTLTDAEVAFVGIGGYSNGTIPSYSLDGYIDEVRVTKSVARYISNFTPETEEFPQGSCAMVSAPYWRMYVTANNGDASYTSLNEWEWYDTVGGTDLTNASSPSFGQSSAFQGAALQTAAYLTDNDDHTDANNAWVTVGGGATPSWAYVGLKQNSRLTPFIVKEVKMWPQAGGLVTRAPKDFQIQYSYDASSWTTIKTFTNVTGWVSGTAKTFTIQE